MAPRKPARAGGGSGRSRGRRTGKPATVRRRRARPGAARRRLLVLAGVLTVAASLLVSVDRTSGGRMLAESINQYRTEEQLLLTRLADELVRVDSLSSRERILQVAGRRGFRPAEDHEILHLPDVGP